MAGAAVSLWGILPAEPAAEENCASFCGAVRLEFSATDVYDGMFVEGGVKMLNVNHEACSCQCQCMLS